MKSRLRFFRSELVLVFALGMSLGSRAANFVVTSLADSGAGSLRAALNAANANVDADVITFDAALSGAVITLNSQLVLSNLVTIDASALADEITLMPSAAPTETVVRRIFEVTNAVVELNDLTIRGGSAFGSGTSFSGAGGGILVGGGAALVLNRCSLVFNYALRDGGAIAVTGNSAVTLNRCIIARNTADEGGGIHVSSGSQLTASDCTFSDNIAIRQGGAIYASQSCTLSNACIHDNVALGNGGGLFAGGLVANNTTIAGNVARVGGGVFGTAALLTNCTVAGNAAWVAEGGYFNLNGNGSGWVNSILAGNTAPTNANFRNPAAFISHSLTNGDPMLSTLGAYGGTTPTMPPLAGSPAIDAGDDSVTNSLTTDQRGLARLAGAHVDIGAVEAQMADPSNAPVLKLTFVSSPDTDFTVQAATNAALPADGWSILGSPTQDSPGFYEFTDVFTDEYPRRFYRVSSP